MWGNQYGEVWVQEQECSQQNEMWIPGVQVPAFLLPAVAFIFQHGNYILSTLDCEALEE